MPGYRIRQLNESDRPWVQHLLTEHWGAYTIVTRGRVHQADELPGFVAEVDGERCGLVTYRIEDEQCEVISLNSLRAGRGVGTALLDAARASAREAGCQRIWLITSNDNLPAVRFYQRRGWRLVAVHRGALDEARRLKPEIPLVGLDGIPLHDEIEMELPP